ncbi:MAG: Dolichyl-phosphate-mannose-protein mannosyltransferase [Planctomycetota bacterium]
MDRNLESAGGEVTPAARLLESPRALLGIAFAIFLIGALRDIAAPWEDGLRGVNAAVYEECFVRTILDWPSSVSHFAPGWVMVTDQGPVCQWHWHHPALYPLTLSLFAWIFGQQPLTLRLVTLLLVLPALFALHRLLSRAVSPVFAAWAVLLFACNAMIGYFLPMVVHDGATMTFGLLACTAFWRFAEEPRPRHLAICAALFFVATQFDFLGHLWGVSMFLLALASAHRKQALVGIAALFCVSLVSMWLVALHYSFLFGGPLEFLAALSDLSKGAESQRVTAEQFGYATRHFLVDYGAWSIYALAGVGGVALLASASPQRRRIAWLALALVTPGALGSLVSLRHYVDHAFWTMPMTAGIATLAAGAPWAAIRLLQDGGARRRIAAAALLLCSLAAVAHGAVSVHQLIAKFQPRDGSFAASIAEAEPYARGVSVVLTDAEVEMRAYLPGVLTLGSVSTVAQLDQWIEFARARAMLVEVAFLLSRDAADAALRQRLEQLAKPNELRRWSVYRFQVR